MVFYSPEAVAIKKLEPVSKDQIYSAFAKAELIVMTDPSEFENWLLEQDLQTAVLLLLSSGNYGGLDLSKINLPE